MVGLGGQGFNTCFANYGGRINVVYAKNDYNAGNG